MNKLLSYLYIAYFFISSGVLVWGAAITCLFTRHSDPLRLKTHRYACWWAHHYITMNPFWKVKWEGLDNIDPTKAAVLVSNHQSYWDIMLLYGLYKPFKWVSKEEIFKVPFIGWNMELNQYVKIARGDLSSIKEMMATCKNWLKKGATIMIFPEGTRSPDGEIIEFRDGPFKMASDCNVPVIPIVVDGTHRIMPKNANEINFKGELTVRILPPLYPADFDNNARKMREHVRALMIAELSGIRKLKSETAATAISDKERSKVL